MVRAAVLAAVWLVAGCESPGGDGAPCTKARGDCIPTHYCDFPDDTCGASGPGVCVERPAEVVPLFSPVCACDGDLFDSPGAAHAAGVDDGSSEHCALADTSLECGGATCYGGDVDYCRIVSTGTCLAFPAGCGSCDCVPSPCEGAVCTDRPDGHTVVECPTGLPGLAGGAASD